MSDTRKVKSNLLTTSILVNSGEIESLNINNLLIEYKKYNKRKNKIIPVKPEISP